MQQKIHVEAARDRAVGLSPFGDQNGGGVFPVEEGAHILPQGDRALLFRVVLDKRTRHIHAEAVAAEPQPEAHDVFHLLAR